MYKENFEELVKENEPFMRKLIKNKFVDGYDREDLYQECLMVLDRCNREYDDSKNTKFSTFLYISVSNMLADLIKTSKREKRPDIINFDFDDTMFNDVIDNNDVVDELDRAVLYNTMLEVLRTLPRGDITIAVYDGQKTMKEVAEEHGISESRVQQLNKRNINFLKKIFN